MARKIIDAAGGSNYNQPQPSFNRNEFNASIWKHGYDIICEQAIRCPCQGNSDSPLPSCLNCHGFGYFYINPTRIKALVTGLNKSTQYVQWAPELMGTSSITVRDEDKDNISYFNRITIESEYAVFTEMLVAMGMLGGEVAVFTSYAPVNVVSVYIYNGSNVPLIKLEDGVDYHLSVDNPYCIDLTNDAVKDGVSISILYKHNVEYHIIDLPHEIRSSLTKDPVTGAFNTVKLPVQAIGRRTHLVDSQRPNYDGGGIIYNDDVTT